MCNYLLQNDKKTEVYDNIMTNQFYLDDDQKIKNITLHDYKIHIDFESMLINEDVITQVQFIHNMII